MSPSLIIYSIGLISIAFVSLHCTDIISSPLSSSGECLVRGASPANFNEHR